MTFSYFCINVFFPPISRGGKGVGVGKQKRPILEVLCGNMEEIMKQIGTITPNTKVHGDLQRHSFDKLDRLVISLVSLNKVLHMSDLNEADQHYVAESTRRCKDIRYAFPEPVKTAFDKMVEPFGFGIH